MDRHVVVLGLRPTDARRPFLWYVCLYTLWCIVAFALCHHFQSPPDKRLEVVACVGAAATAARWVCQVCHSLGSCQGDERIWIYDTQHEAFCHCAERGYSANALHRAAEGDRFGSCLFVVLPDVLSWGYARQCTFYGCGNGNILCCGNKIRGNNAFRHPVLGG